MATRRTVSAGKLPDGWVLPTFSFQRDAKDEGKNWIEAGNRCVAAGLALCTEQQWDRACAADSSLAKIETWTSSLSGKEGFVVRGGRTCGSRSIAASASERSARRAGACCSRAIAVRTGNGPGFIRATTRHLMEFENAINQRSTSALTKKLNQSVMHFGRRKSRGAVVAAHGSLFRKYSSLWVVHDRCKLTVQAADDTWTARCNKVTQQDGKMSYVEAKYVWGGRSQAMEKMSDARVFFTPETAPTGPVAVCKNGEHRRSSCSCGPGYYPYRECRGGQWSRCFCAR